MINHLDVKAYVIILITRKYEHKTTLIPFTSEDSKKKNTDHIKIFSQ